jgi:VanZ family protein
VITWGPAALWAAVLFLLSSTSDPPGASWFPLGDKVAHIGLYAVLGGTLAWSRVHAGSRLPPMVFLALGLLFALSDEWHQSFVVGRDSSAGDLAADVVGLLLGYTVVAALLSRRQLAKALARSSRPL